MVPYCRGRCILIDLLFSCLFAFSIKFVIIFPNNMRMLLGSNGLVLVSYRLVIYYQNSHSYEAGMLTVLSNRIGDLCIVMAIA